MGTPWESLESRTYPLHAGAGALVRGHPKCGAARNWPGPRASRPLPPVLESGKPPCPLASVAREPPREPGMDAGHEPRAQPRAAPSRAGRWSRRVSPSLRTSASGRGAAGGSRPAEASAAVTPSDRGGRGHAEVESLAQGHISTEWSQVSAHAVWPRNPSPHHDVAPEEHLGPAGPGAQGWGLAAHMGALLTVHLTSRAGGTRPPSSPAAFTRASEATVLP